MKQKAMKTRKQKKIDAENDTKAPFSGFGTLSGSDSVSSSKSSGRGLNGRNGRPGVRISFALLVRVGDGGV